MSDDNMFYCSFVSIHYIICECGETFPTEEELKVHLERDHSHQRERKEYKCGICEALFNTEEACIEHYENSHLEIKQEHDYVEPADDGEDTKEVCIEHYENSHLEIKQEHDYVEMETGDDGEDTKEVKYETVIVEPNIANQLNIKTRPKKCKPYHNAKNIVCEVCGKRYASNAALRYHQRVHTGERPYKCTECPKSFTMPLFLQIHVRTHTGERPYECPQCPKAFSNKAALLRHDRVHTGVKPYECPECGKFFTQSNSMKLHVNTVHLKMPAPYKSKNRKNKAKEKEMLRNAILKVMDPEEIAAVDSITENKEIYIKPEVDLYQQEVEETEILYEDVDSREITYEVIYEE